MSSLALMQIIGSRYQVLETIGQGGMGTVYRVSDRLTGEIVALKQVTTSVEQLDFGSKAASQDFRRAMAQEFRTLASLRHPHIISVLDYGFDENRLPYYTMDLLEDHQSIVQYGRKQPAATQHKLMVQLLQALVYLHRHGIIHRDLKPDNVMVVLSEDGTPQVKVLDFGLAVARGAQEDDQVVGTITHMAPEVLNGTPSNEVSDLYAVGIIAYELFAGKHPFNISSINQLIADIMLRVPDVSRLDAAEWLMTLVERLLAKNPQDRYQSAFDLLQDYIQHLGGELRLESASIRESFLQAAKFVGRIEEFQQLTQALHRAVSGSGSTWLIGGESGVGKSRLLDELRSQALVDGAVVLRGQGIAEGGAPYQLWREAMRWLVLLTPELTEDEASIAKELVPDIGTLLRDADETPLNIPDAPRLPPQDSQRRLVLLVQTLLQRQQKPIVIILEDVHWAVESLEILKQVIRICERLPLLVVGSYRNDERPQLPNELPGTQVLTLNRLTESEIRQLSGAILGDAGREESVVDLIQRETEGNVYFIVEVIRALAEEAGQLDQVAHMTLPVNVFAGGMARIIQRRLSRVPKSARDLLNLAGVLGRFLDLRLLSRAASKLDLDDWLLECSTASVLEVHEGRWRFSHDKLRDMMLMEIPAEQIPLLNRQAAEILEAEYPDDPTQILSLALHWRKAGVVEKERHYVFKAGELMSSSFAIKESIVHYERALALTPPDSPLYIQLHVRLGESHSLGDYKTAKVYLKSMLPIAEQAGDDTSLARAYAQLGRMAMLRDGNLDETETFTSESIEAAKRSQDAVALASALRQMGNFYLFQGKYDEAEDYLTESVATARRIQDSFLEGMALNSLSDVYAKRNQGSDHDLAIDLSNQVADIGRQMGNRRLVMFGISHLGLVALHRREFVEAHRYFAEAYTLTEEINDTEQLGKVKNYVAICLLGQDDLRGAWTRFLEALRISIKHGSQPEIVRALGCMGVIWWRQGRSAEGLELMALALHHPRCNQETHELLDPLYTQLQTEFEPATSEAIIAQGKARDLALVSQMILERGGLPT